MTLEPWNGVRTLALDGGGHVPAPPTDRSDTAEAVV